MRLTRDSNGEGDTDLGGSTNGDGCPVASCHATREAQPHTHILAISHSNACVVS